MCIWTCSLFSLSSLDNSLHKIHPFHQLSIYYFNRISGNLLRVTLGGFESNVKSEKLWWLAANPFAICGLGRLRTEPSSFYSLLRGRTNKASCCLCRGREDVFSSIVLYQRQQLVRTSNSDSRTSSWWHCCRYLTNSSLPRISVHRHHKNHSL